jgi:hypothetical protein
MPVAWQIHPDLGGHESLRNAGNQSSVLREAAVYPIRLMGERYYLALQDQSERQLFCNLI